VREARVLTRSCGARLIDVLNVGALGCRREQEEGRVGTI
jgi:hypothetical protein